MKKLDEEYKKACAEETPDLWNRIEAGLPQKTEQTAKEKDRAAASPQTQSSASKAGTGTQTQAAIRKVWMRYGAFVAAAVMALVTVPGLLRMTQAKNTAENAAPMSVQDMTAAKENTTGMTDTEGIAADSADTAFADAFPGECDDAYSEEAENGAAVEISSATEMLPGVSSMELKVTAVEEYDGYELVSAVSGDGMFETKAVFPEEVKKKLDFTLTEGEYYTFTLRQDTDKDFPYCHIVAVEQEGE
ncbi:MAG: hypothetical protein ACM677_08840 [Bacteroides sp.]